MLRAGKLLVLSSLIAFFLSFSASPAFADSDIPVFGGLWDAISCASDLNCLVRGAATAGENFVFHTMVGRDFDKLTYSDLNSMMAGRWDSGFVGAADNLLASLYNNPPDIHLASYFREELSDNILASPVQATVGTDFLKPITTLWAGMRNLAYGLFLIVMVVIGLMIILRREIAPRVVISFTNALPRIVIGLVLITFSFPLVALAVDIGLVLGSELVWSTFGTLLFTNLSQFFDTPGVIADALTQGVASGNAAQVVAAGLAGIGGVKDALLALGLGIIFAIAAVVVYFLASFRLIISYFKIVMATIFSPLIILFGSLPGQEGVLSDLAKRVLVDVLTFPATLFFLMVGLWFSGLATTEFPFFISDTTANVSIKAASLAVSFIPVGSILALLTVALAWKAPSMIEEALGVGGKPKGKK